MTSCFTACCKAMSETSTATVMPEMAVAPEDAWELPSPINDPATSTLLVHCKDVTPPPAPTLSELLSRSSAFPVPFPVETVRCQSLLDVGAETLEAHAAGARPVLHEAALHMAATFIIHKRAKGSAVEKALYANMDVVGLVQRLLEKRAVTFYNSNDQYLLLDGWKGRGGWELVGTESEQHPLLLDTCLSYDEMKLSAFLSVSSHSEFINDGRRTNRGVRETDEHTIEPRGVIVGVIGSRLEKIDVMEWQEVVVTKEQNSQENGYGPISAASEDGSEDKCGWRQLWANFLGISPNLPLFEDALADNSDRFHHLSTDRLFDNLAYKLRTAVSVETLLLEAEQRAADAGVTVVVHVVGFGLGVWRLSSHQERLFLDVFAKSLKNLSLPRVTDVHFAYFHESSCGGVASGGVVGGARVHFSLRAPHSRLVKGRDQLLIVSYAWDSNALPGNEFWDGLLDASGDPAAACSTQIAELHNPHVNPRVCGANLHVASRLWGVLPLAEYIRKSRV